MKRALHAVALVAAELAYIDLGNPNDTVNDQRIEAEINGVAPYVVGTIPLGPLELFAKAGYYFYDNKGERREHPGSGRKH